MFIDHRPYPLPRTLYYMSYTTHHIKTLVFMPFFGLLKAKLAKARQKSDARIQTPNSTALVTRTPTKWTPLRPQFLETAIQTDARCS